MKNFENAIQVLKSNHIILDEGLSPNELKRIEDIYKVNFPKELLKFFMIVLPVSNGFYNWRNFNDVNIDYIKQQINTPIQDIIELAEEIEWNDKWGTKPSTTEEIKKIIQNKLFSAPKLIPFCGHRYIPEIDSNKCPVLSVHGVDIIYYGNGIEEYISIEYGNKHQNTIDFKNMPNIDFWSELL